MKEENIFPANGLLLRGPNIFRLTSSSGATLWSVTLKPWEWIIYSSVWDSNCQKQQPGGGSEQIKWNTCLQTYREPVCVVYHTVNVTVKSSTPCLELAGARHWSSSLHSCDVSADRWRLRGKEEGEGSNQPFTGACSEMHMLRGLLMVLQRRAQFCLDCLRMDSSGQLVSLCS